MGADTFPRPGAACRVKKNGRVYTGKIVRRFMDGTGWWVNVDIYPGRWDEIPAELAEIEKVSDDGIATQ